MRSQCHLMPTTFVNRTSSVSAFVILVAVLSPSWSNMAAQTLDKSDAPSVVLVIERSSWVESLQGSVGFPTKDAGINLEVLRLRDEHLSKITAQLAKYVRVYLAPSFSGQAADLDLIYPLFVNSPAPGVHEPSVRVTDTCRLTLRYREDRGEDYFVYQGPSLLPSSLWQKANWKEDSHRLQVAIDLQVSGRLSWSATVNSRNSSVVKKDMLVDALENLEPEFKKLRAGNCAA